MKDRIRQVMESQRMTQQEFAQLIELAPATLSSIFNGRTRPTLNVIEAIKKKISAVNTDWLVFGVGKMYDSRVASQTSNFDVADQENLSNNDVVTALELGFEDAPSSSADVMMPQNQIQRNDNANGVRNTRLQNDFEITKNFDKIARRVTEIRVFYDDLTYESFVPAKK